MVFMVVYVGLDWLHLFGWFSGIDRTFYFKATMF